MTLSATSVYIRAKSSNMGIGTILMIAVGLAMDSLAVSVSGGIVMRPFRLGQSLRLALTMGVFQGGMTLLGWALGVGFSSYITAYDHWIAFVLLAFLGGKMIYESFGGGEESTEINPYDALSGYFKPEFLNRMDGILFFNELTEQDLKAIFQLELGKLRKRLHEHHKELSISDGFLARILENITGSANTGAREVRRLVEGKITDIVAEKLLKSPEAKTVSLTAKDA